MLDLVLTDRHHVRPVQENVGRHEDRVVQQTRWDALHVLRLIFELRHPLELAQWRHGVEQPHERGVFRYVRLHEQRYARRIDPGTEQAHGHLAGALGQSWRIVARAGERMQVHHAIEAFVLGLQCHPVLHGTEQVADVQFTGRLDPGKDAGHAGNVTKAHGASQDLVIL